MTTPDLLSINNVAEKLELSVHQLRRWELMFGLEIKRGRGQQRQYRAEDMSVLERIKELVDQGWPTSQIRPQLEAEGLLTPKLIGMPVAPGNPEVLQESIIGLRNFTERRFIELSKQVDELRQLLISITLKQELSTDKTSPWQPMAPEYVPTPKVQPAQEITIGPQISIDPPGKPSTQQPYTPRPIIGAPSQSSSYGASSSSSYGSGSQGGTIIGASTSTDSIYTSRSSEPDMATRGETGSASDSAISMSSMVRHSTIPPLPAKVQDQESLPAQEVAMAEDSTAPVLTSPATSNDDQPVANVSAGELDAVFDAPQAATSATESFAPMQLSASAPTSAEPSVSPSSFTSGFESGTPAPIPVPAPQTTPLTQPGASAFAVARGLNDNLAASEAVSRANQPEPALDLEQPVLAPAQPVASSSLDTTISPVTELDEEENEPEPQVLPAIAEDFSDAPPPALPVTAGPQVNFGPNVSAPQVTAQKVDDNFGLGEVTDQNYLTVLGRALDLIGWTDEQADSYSLKAFSVPHWDELGRSQAEKLVSHLVGILKEQLGN